MSYDYINNIFPCVDWLRGIVEIYDVKKFCSELEKIDERLKFENFDLYGTGLLNYSKRYAHNVVPSFTFAFNPVDPSDENCLTASAENYHINKINPYIILSLSGDAIRFLGHESLKKLIKMLAKNKFHCTRIDLAADFYDAANPIVPLLQEACSHFMCPSKGDITLKTQTRRDPKNFQCYVNCDPKTGETSENYVLGHHGSSHAMMRLYDKRFECLYGRNRKIGAELVNGRDYWYRLELELHNGKHRAWADEVFYNLANNTSLFALFGHSLKQFITVVEKKYAGTSNTGLDVIVIDWNEFIDQLINNIDFAKLVL